MKVVNENALDFFRRAGRCEWCGGYQRNGRDPAHIFSRGAGRLDIPENIIALCRSCHTAAHWGKISRLQLLVVVGQRECLLIEDIEELVYRLRRMPKGSGL